MSANGRQNQTVEDQYELVRKLRPPKRADGVVRFEAVPGEFCQHDFGQHLVRYEDGSSERVRFFASRLKYSRMVRVLLVADGRSAHGVPVDITAHGSVDTDAGRLTLEVRVARSLLLLDPALAVLGLLDVLTFAATQPWSDHPDADVHVRSRADLYDEHGRDSGGWRVVTALGRTGGSLGVAKEE